MFAACVGLVGSLVLTAGPVRGQGEPAAKPERLTAPQEWLVLAPVDARGRQPFNPDAVFLRYLLDRSAPPPRAGESVQGTNKAPSVWTAIAPNEKGWVAGKIAYAYTAYSSDRAQIVLASVPGGATLCVNGDAHSGDVYGGNGVGIPVALRKGTNHIFVRGVRGRFQLRLTTCAPGLNILAADATKPDLGVGEAVDTRLGAVVVNASQETIPELTTSYGEFERPFHGGLAPLGLRKVWVGLAGPAPKKIGEQKFTVQVNDATREFVLAVRDPAGPRRRTYLSFIDASLQQYSEILPTGEIDDASIALSLHGAGVDAFGQARSYGPKPDFYLVCPTNRRRFGFDWQDWGRIDAYEALTQVLLRTGISSSRVFLTGHSMGGHGTWHLAALDPDGFVAAGPSAGWCSFDSYVGRPPSAGVEPWRGADGSSNTLDYLSNLVQTPVYILHGADDDNVPAREGKDMQKVIAEAGGRVVAHFEPGVKHWWDKNKEAKGADCVDWAPMWTFFRNVLSDAPRKEPDRIAYRTVDPATDPEHYWIRLVQAQVPGVPVGITAERDATGVRITTTNLRSFASMLRGAPRKFVIDGEVVRARSGATFLRTNLGWTVAEPPVAEKSADRCGPLKRVFAHRFVLVYGEDDREALARARYDQQRWWYRGNGDCAVVSDVQFLAGNYADRNVILYGNRMINSAFAAVLPRDCPFDVTENKITLGKRAWTGAGLACAFVYPRRGEDQTLVGVFGATGIAGARLSYVLAPFVSGIGYPDYTVFDASVLTKGAEAVHAAGWFDFAWRLPTK